MIDAAITTPPTKRFITKIPLMLNWFRSLPIVYVMNNHQLNAPIAIPKYPVNLSYSNTPGCTKASLANNPMKSIIIRGLDRVTKNAVKKLLK